MKGIDLGLFWPEHDVVLDLSAKIWDFPWYCKICRIFRKSQRTLAVESVATTRQLTNLQHLYKIVLGNIIHTQRGFDRIWYDNPPSWSQWPRRANSLRFCLVRASIMDPCVGHKKSGKSGFGMIVQDLSAGPEFRENICRIFLGLGNIMSTPFHRSEIPD